MKITKFIKAGIGLIFLTVLLLTLRMGQLNFSPKTASAQSLWDTAQEGGLKDVGDKAFGTPGEPKDIRVITADIIKAVLDVLGIILVGLIIYAGYKWMTAGGNEEPIREAKSLLLAAVIGLIIVLAAWGITNFVISNLINATKV